MGEDLTVHWVQPCRGGGFRSPGIVLSRGAAGRRFGGGRFRVACMPTRKNVHGLRATGSPRAVSCPSCRAAPGFPEAGPLQIRRDCVPPAVEKLITGE